MCSQLWSVGIEEVYLDGSFTEAKAHPNDIDGYFEFDAGRVATGELQRELNKIDPKKCWTWDPEERRSYRGYAKKQLPMWHAYRVELTRTTTSLLASPTSKDILSRSRPPFANGDGTTSRKAS